MKISYKAVGGPSYTTLYDQTSSSTGFDPTAVAPAALPTFSPKFTPEVQQEPIAFSTNHFRAARGNIMCSLTLQFEVGYNTQQAALASIRTYYALLNQVIHLQVVQDGETQYYPNALVTGYEADVVGVGVQHRFQFDSDGVTATAP